MVGTRTSLDVAIAPWWLSSLASRDAISGSVWPLRNEAEQITA